jgi:hypothetical protein
MSASLLAKQAQKKTEKDLKLAATMRLKAGEQPVFETASEVSNHSSNRNILTAKNLFVLYLVISSNFLPNLFGCQVQELFNKSIIAKHVIAFLTLYFFISLVEPSEFIPSSMIDRLKFALIIYVWFMISTKMSLKFWAVFIFCIGSIYVIQLNVENEKKQLVPNDQVIKDYENNQKMLLAVSAVVTLIGFVSYMGEKKYEYGSDFKFLDLFVGDVACKGNFTGVGKPSLSFLDSLKSAFGMKF